ncbi:GntR family transcriptional regulator [Paraferrimonas haliotis]|uniref:GntR family transcriptional regulator n=1 Tax=Paraferrimonas haliotis TaxID=2013866 RepID=A0AA37TT89_9GAMM|nr:GntR family transcriptional regulator [Paraferrimonas haliotis]GLS83855.1 GntR family transcriptional regulator [Paraferrimonas haliotis]GLS83982.1 GntR family transcriptional regulator [Paraferrimonas haliotis]
MSRIRPKKILSVKDQIADQLRTDIIAGDLQPDTKLNEKELAERFGLSRGPIRDVILQLTKEGLLISKKNCGASVNSVLDPKTQKLMVKIRREIEVFAIDQLKGKLTQEDFDDLHSILADLQRAFAVEDYTEVTKHDLAFHHYLVERAGGDELVNIWYPHVMRMRLNYKRVSSSEACYQEHLDVIKALEADDTATATKAIKANIR